MSGSETRSPLQLTPTLDNRLSKAVNVWIVGNDGHLSLFDQQGNEIISSNPETQGKKVNAGDQFDITLKTCRQNSNDASSHVSTIEEITYVVNGIEHVVHAS